MLEGAHSNTPEVAGNRPLSCGSGYSFYAPIELLIKTKNGDENYGQLREFDSH